MKKRFLVWLIGLMSIALLGIIAVQVYWIKLAFKVKEEQFNRTVFSAMNEINDKLDSYKTVELIGESFIKVESNNSFEKKITWNEKKKEKFYITNIEEHDILVNNNNKSDTIILKKNIHTPAIENIEKIHISNDSLVEVQVKFDHHDGHNYSIYETVTNTNQGKVVKTIKQLALELNNEEFDILSLARNDYLKKIVFEELTDKGIDTAVNFVIKDFSTDSLLNELSYGNLDKQINQSMYKVKMFPKNLLERPYELIIEFPNKSKNLFKSLTIWLLASVIFTGIILVIFTITIRIIIRQKQVSEIKSDFINNMTHEFKTPIATISLATDSIGNEKIISSPERITPLLSVIKEENQRMNKQVENVLQMSLIDKKDFNFNFSEVDVHEKIKKAVKNIEVQIKQKEGKIVCNLEAEKSTLYLDANYFMNIMFNLLDNANKYSPNEPKIEISSYNNEDGLFISVKDNGIGMKKEVINKIFDKFYRIPTGNIHDIKGFGLGLSFVQAIVLAFKGKIEVKSELNKGSEFIIFLPFNQNGNKN